VLAQLEKNYPEDVRHVYRHNPLIGTPDRPFFDKTVVAVLAAEAAGNQGKFWEMHDLLYSNQPQWRPMEKEVFRTWIQEQAVSELRLDQAQFVADMNDEEKEAEIHQIWEDHSAIGLSFTPFLLINGNPWPNNLPMDYNSLEAVIRLTLLEDQQFESCPPMQIDQSKQYVATLHTEKGDIVIELFPEHAPMAVNSFIFLAEEGWFDGVTFHRVLPGFVAQAGDPTGTGFGGPGYAFDIEVSPDVKFDQPGLLAMANAGPSSNGSQFFITYRATPELDGGYTIFGRVITGMSVAESLAPRNPQQEGILPPGDVIQSVSIEER
jgi:cyclophilin family peptidyl-prolyl cis-trans isomerase